VNDAKLHGTFFISYYPCRLQNCWDIQYLGGGWFQLTIQTWVNLHLETEPAIGQVFLTKSSRSEAEFEQQVIV
jgi:hypothetical protein